MNLCKIASNSYNIDTCTLYKSTIEIKLLLVKKVDSYFKLSQYFTNYGFYE